MKLNRHHLIVFLFGFLLWVNVTQAETYPRYEIGAGMSLLSFESYPGSKDRHTSVFPFPFFVYRSERLKISREAVQSKLLENNHWEIDFSISGALPVNSSDTSARQGMEDLPPLISIGPKIKYRLFGDLATGRGQLILPVELATAIDFDEKLMASQGIVARPHLKLDRQFHQSKNNYYNLQLNLGAYFRSAQYHDYFYGVNPADVTDQRPLYDGKAGYGGMRLSLGSSLRKGNWWAGAFIRYQNLSGAVFEDSPLVEQNNALSGGFAFAYVFKTSKETITIKE